MRAVGVVVAVVVAVVVVVVPLSSAHTDNAR